MSSLPWKPLVSVSTVTIIGNLADSETFFERHTKDWVDLVTFKTVIQHKKKLWFDLHHRGKACFALKNLYADPPCFVLVCLFLSFFASKSSCWFFWSDRKSNPEWLTGEGLGKQTSDSLTPQHITLEVTTRVRNKEMALGRRYRLAQ